MQARAGQIRSQTVSSGTAGAGWEEFREIWSALPEKPDGLIISDDMLVNDVASAIQSLGIQVPRQLRVVTHMTNGAMIHSPFPVDQLVTDPDAVAQDMADLIVRAVRREPIDRPHRQHSFVLKTADGAVISSPVTQFSGPVRERALHG